MTTPKQARGWTNKVLSIVAILFGLMTLKSGGAVLFGDEAARIAAGNYVPLLLWFNFLSGFVYIGAGVGLWLQKRWAVLLSMALAAAIAFAFVAFGLYIQSGGPYEQRTVIAMIVRLLVWSAIAAISTMNAGRSRSSQD
ncbi:MAG: hypothetical protein AB1722_01765 [Pseudomonadota bacterium]